jgi:hypothetical protein
MSCIINLISHDRYKISKEDAVKFRTYFPFLALVMLVLTVGLTCATPTIATPTAIPQPPTQPPILPPTFPPSPTLAPTFPPRPISVPTDTPAQTEALDYFTDDFSGDLSNWTYYVATGDENKMTLSTDQGGIVTRLDDVNLAVYFYYDPFVYNDVILQLIYRNQGRNSNNVNIVCRYSDTGWYEFTVQNDGLYQIWVHTDDYYLLANGGSTAIQMGQASNEITVACAGNKLILLINGVETRTVTDTKYFLGKGQVGFGVNISPLNPVTPVIVSFDSFTIAPP